MIKFQNIVFFYDNYSSDSGGLVFSVIIKIRSSNNTFPVSCVNSTYQQIRNTASTLVDPTLGTIALETNPTLSSKFSNYMGVFSCS